jgi:uncharacterized membrane protein YfcA
VTEFWLVPIVFLTSCLTAVIGMGPGLVPAGAIIPIHACTQLASNLSRAAFGWRHIDPAIIPAFVAGAVLGAWLGGEIYGTLDLHWLPAIIGVLILVFTWVPLPGSSPWRPSVSTRPAWACWRVPPGRWERLC